ncbi:uncharacterized protein LOC111696693 [Eurytemora carolleeae]|uniref:uncharacterized protein LOC111696693 n=1 Tax=Eurytemora carolleeae TaxID=1294199 RepID=UPI000C7774C2|nr:uncharacterized protein LOC111696693 [Eurytemora carolleeae]|eukprot:XP_023322162.1 uncharacterized protein LOC111696693 [Eurytemora affinis]
METLIIFSTLLFSAYSTSTKGDGLVLEEFAGKRANEVVLKYTENMENRKLETIDQQTNDQDDGRPRYPVKRRSRNQDGVFRRKILPLQLSKLMNVSETLSISAPKTEQYLDLDNSKNPNSSRRIKKVQIKSKKIQTSRLPTQKELKRFKAKYFSPPTHYKDFFLKKIFESPKESKKIPEIFENGGSTADKVPELAKTIMAATTKQLDLPVNDEITLTRDDIGSDSLLDSLNRSMLLKNGGRDRSSRFLSLFTVIRFKNEICLTSEATNGTCYTQTDCEEKGGEPQGPCASGFGVCCYFEYMCSSSTSENGTYFVNPATPHPMCNLMINRMNDDICQIKLQLDVFEIAGPDDKGECSDEFFLVTGGSPVPPICGLNSGQHLIYSITPDSGPSQLSVILSVSSTMSSNARLWNIRIYQRSFVQ